MKLTMAGVGECEILKDDTVVPDMLFKAILIGDAGVGKSCILHRAVANEFKDEYEVTIGAEFSSIVMRVRGKTIQLQVWDTAGQENFRSMIRVFYKNSHAAFLVYDLTRKVTFDKLGDWMTDVKENALPDVKMMLIGNLKDHENNRQVPSELAQEFVTRNGLVGMKETSAKTGEGVIEAFVEMARVLYLESEKASPKKGDHKGASKLKRPKVMEKKGCC